MNKVLIRKYQDQDKQKIVELTKGFQTYINSVDQTNETRNFSSKKEIERYVDNFFEDIQNMNGEMFVAILKDNIVGYVYGVIQDRTGQGMYQLNHQSKKEGWIGIVVTEPIHRGKGIGKQLITQIKKFFIEKQCDSIRLIVNSHNCKAIDLYEALGFKIYELKMKLAL